MCVWILLQHLPVLESVLDVEANAWGRDVGVGVLWVGSSREGGKRTSRSSSSCPGDAALVHGSDFIIPVCYLRNTG